MDWPKELSVNQIVFVFLVNKPTLDDNMQVLLVLPINPVFDRTVFVFNLA